MEAVGRMRVPACAIVAALLIACDEECPLPPGCHVVDRSTCKCERPRRPHVRSQGEAALCDGSSRMRVIHQSGGGGFPGPAQPFLSPYGDQFFAIDGACRFYAQDNPIHPIESGTLTRDYVTQLEADIAWDQLAEWGLHHQPTCEEAPGALLAVHGVGLLCGGLPERGCGCDQTAPDGLQEAQDNARRWLAELLEVGAPLSGPLGAVALELETAPAAAADRWPLERSMASIPNLIVNRQQAQTGPYARFDRPEDTAKLRDLRRGQPEAARAAPFELHVREGDRDYELYLRDELPSADARAIESLLASWRFD